MRFDKSQLAALAALPDDKLWEEAKKMASKYGFELPKETPPHNQMEKLREMALGSKINLSDAMRLLNQYKTR